MTAYPQIYDERHRDIDDVIVDCDRYHLRYLLAEQVVNSLVPAIRVSVQQAAESIVGDYNFRGHREMALQLIRERLMNELANLLSLQTVFTGDEWRFEWLNEENVRAYMSYPKVTQNEPDGTD